jgi:predicted PolB exonuclease-like 3'-5' exonuclease
MKSKKLENYLFFDIETVSEHKEMPRDDDDFYTFEYRNREKDEVATIEEAIERYKKSAALCPSTGKIVCISIAFVKDEIVYVKSLVGEEKEILTEFVPMLNKHYTPIGYNINYFDIPYVRLRSAKNNLLNLFDGCRFDDRGKKPWTIESVDLMDEVRGTFNKNISFDKACRLHELESPKKGIKGSDVSFVYWNEKDGTEQISDYCESDVISCVHLFCKLTGQDFPKEIVRKVNLEKTPLLKEIADICDFPKDFKERVQELLKDKNIDLHLLKELILQLVITPTSSEKNKKAKKKFIEENVK